MKKSVVFIFLITFLTNCSLDNEHIRRNEWKSGGGYAIDDYLTFDGYRLKISNDTIYEMGNAVAIVSNTTVGHFVYDNEIELTSLETGEKGIYHEK